MLPMGTSLATPHGTISFPAFLPDATRAVVRGLDSIDLRQCGVQALVMNVFHLMQKPGTSTVQALGKLHAMSGWPGPIITDSGGFQAYSLIRENPRYGSLTDKGIQFVPEGASRKFLLTPEKSVRLQLNYGADIVICLDDCTHAESPLETQQQSVARTITWARRCKLEFERLLHQKSVSSDESPLLFGVVQGGDSHDLRRECAESLLEIGFDGFGYGGWPLDSSGSLLTEIIGYTRDLIPQNLPMHALGIGHPNHISTCVNLGYQMFDSSLPTRDARQGRLHTRTEDGGFRYLYIQDKKHVKENMPVEAACDCLCCTNFSRGYLHHLFQIRDGLAQRLATLHNLRSMTRLMKSMRSDSDEKNFLAQQ